MSVVLLCATGLFLRSLNSAAHIDVGFRSRGVLMMAVDPSLHGYTAQQTAQFLDQLRDRVAAIPGVASAAITDITPLSGGGRSDGFSIVGRKSNKPNPIVELYMATPGYLETMGIPRIAGRDFGHENPAGQKVAIVSESMATTLFGKENPIGQHVNGAGVDYEIVGIVKNIKARSLGEDLRPVLYRSLDQSISGDPSVMGYSLLVHTAGDSASVAAAVRQTIHTMDPTLAIFNAETIEEHLHEALFLPRLAGTLFGIFGFLGLLLASIGLYSVMSYSVSRRTQEMGVRLALGAGPGDVLRLVLRQGLVQLGVGLAIGLVLALLLARGLQVMLFGVGTADPAVFAAVVAVLVVSGVAACLIPARRATRVDPMAAMRSS